MLHSLDSDLPVTPKDPIYRNGARACSYHAPMLWNHLAASLQAACPLPVFQRRPVAKARTVCWGRSFDTELSEQDGLISSEGCWLLSSVPDGHIPNPNRPVPQESPKHPRGQLTCRLPAFGGVTGASEQKQTD